MRRAWAPRRFHTVENRPQKPPAAGSPRSLRWAAEIPQRGKSSGRKPRSAARSVDPSAVGEAYGLFVFEGWPSSFGPESPQPILAPREPDAERGVLPGPEL